MLAFLFIQGTLLAQNKTVTGTVTDDQSKPLVGATVSTSNGKSSTQTNSEGKFTLSVPTGTKTLMISYVNFETTSVSINANGVADANLKVRNNSLDEVVVVGYGTQKKPEVTGAIARVGGAEIENKPFTSIDKGLQGGVAGLQSLSGSGQPGSSQSIRIRGIGSISAGANPLWVIDGVPVNTGDLSRLTTTSNALSTINPNDIESISVLKDAAAASIYGSRAANGVILVTTKKGRSGKTKFRFDAETGQSDIAYYNEVQLVEMIKQLFFFLEVILSKMV